MDAGYILSKNKKGQANTQLILLLLAFAFAIFMLILITVAYFPGIIENLFGKLEKLFGL